ncbi:MAG TPA: GlsB/YeaQ/YmgE family stress response membrane protein [Planctomycetaceae bacterium]
METLWAIIVWAVFGLVAGAIARLLVPGRQPIGLLGTMVVGIVGSFVGGFLASLLFGDRDLLSPSGWIGSIVGAVIILAIWVAIAGRRRTTV